MLVRLKEFGEAYGHRFPDGAPARAAFASIEEALNQLATFEVQRLEAKRQDVEARAFARETLVNMMESISRAARLLKAKDPEFPNVFLMPVQESAEAVLTTARLFAKHVEPFADRFREHSLGKSFPENFKRLLQRFAEAIEGRERGKGSNTAARKSIQEALASGRAAAHRLDIIVRQELANDPAAIGDWERSRRIGYRLGDKPEDTVTTQVKPPGDTSPPPSSAAAKSTEAGTEVSDVATSPMSAAPSEVIAPIEAAASDTPEVSEAAAETEAAADAEDAA